jgi:hypothetical protein
VERRTNERPDEVEPVVLTRKYAQAIDGIDLPERRWRTAAAQPA